MITLSPTKVDTREMLRKLAEWQVAGRLDRCSTVNYAEVIRVCAPALRGERDDTTVIGRFEELCSAVVLVDGCENGTVHWCEVLGGASGNDLDGQALDAARARLDATLDEMTGRG